MNLVSLLDDLYVPLTGISERTRKLYGMTLKSWQAFLGEPPTTEHLAELPVARFLAHRVRERAAATAAKDRAQIRALWEFAARRGIVETWPQIRRIRVPERVPRCWLTEEIERLLEAAGDRQGVVSGVPASIWWRSAILTCYCTGCRIGELLCVRWSDVSPAGIIFRAETRKNQTRDILRPISEVCREAIEATRTDRLLVWEWDRCMSNLWRHLGLICRAAGLPDDRMSKFHRIRRTTASYAAAGGLDPQRLLDHSSPAVTRRYLDPRVVTQPSATDVLPKVG